MIYNFILLTLKVAGVKICQVGVSFDKMTKKEEIVTWIRSRLCHTFVVRDKESFSYLTRSNINPRQVIPDLSFNLYSKKFSQPKKIKYTATFSFRTDKGIDLDKLQSVVAQIISSQNEDSCYLFASQVERDSAGMSRLYAFAREQFGEHRVEFADFHSDFSKAEKYYSSSNAIYSNRLHTLLFGAYFGATPIAIISKDKNKKITSLFSDLGYESNILDIESPIRPEIKPFRTETTSAQFKSLSNFFDELFEIRDDSPPKQLK